MIRVLMLDLVDTLIKSDTVLPHVPEALDTMSSFKTTSGEPLAMCLISDFLMPTPPPTQEKIEAIFQDFLLILDRFNLRGFFKPVSERITLSTHAGVFKPDKKLFETAIRRLGVGVQHVEPLLKECLFIAENPVHISECKKLGMSTLQFGGTGSEGVDFSNWSEAPLLIAKLVAPDSNVNMKLALELYLADIHNINLVSLEEPTKSKDTIHARAKALYPISDPKLGELDGVHVELPIDVVIQLNERGQVKSVQIGQPSSEYISGVKSFLQSLLVNQQVSLTQGKPSPRATHHVEVDSKGRRVLIRKRFLAV